jgi:hypothetical protein
VRQAGLPPRARLQGRCAHVPGALRPAGAEEARFGAAAMLMGKRDGVAYDEVRLHAPGEIAAIESWIGLVHAAARAPLSAAPA